MTRYHMQKSEREITEKTVLEEILKRGRFAVIGLCRESDPYVVTLSYGYDPTTRSLYFHTARTGLKLEYLKANPSACATVIEDRGYIMGECAHAYRSVVVRGNMTVVETLEEKKHGLEVILGHLEIDPEVVRKRSLADDRAYARAAILRLDILEITGKAGR
jgi:nitroimidazol reductase NimA-like FMN-containing flavoprotein (pyridoxamine 5'-phosphate oxidase superfamily)